MNALLQAASHGIQISNATLYTTTYPCALCAKMLINGGVVRVVTTSDYPDQLAKEMLAEADIPVEFFSPHGKRHTPKKRPKGR
jgi:dCMP deaminase